MISPVSILQGATRRGHLQPAVSCCHLICTNRDVTASNEIDNLVAFSRIGCAQIRMKRVLEFAVVNGICSPVSTIPSWSESTQVRIVLVLASFKASCLQGFPNGKDIAEESIARAAIFRIFHYAIAVLIVRQPVSIQVFKFVHFDKIRRRIKTRFYNSIILIIQFLVAICIFPEISKRIDKKTLCEARPFHIVQGAGFECGGIEV